jgi:hypothetical protein
MPRTDILHRHHSIKTMKKGSGFQARAFRGGKAVGDTFTGDTLDAARR